MVKNIKSTSIIQYKILVGSHRDAWSHGAISPSSGLTAMLNSVLAFNKTMTYYNWRPRRSIIFAAWGAGEFGNIGSGEWVDENFELLKQVHQDKMVYN